MPSLHRMVKFFFQNFFILMPLNSKYTNFWGAFLGNFFQFGTKIFQTNNFSQTLRPLLPPKHPKNSQNAISPSPVLKYGSCRDGSGALFVNFTKRQN